MSGTRGNRQKRTETSATSGESANQRGRVGTGKRGLKANVNGRWATYSWKGVAGKMKEKIGRNAQKKGYMYVQIVMPQKGRKREDIKKESGSELVCERIDEKNKGEGGKAKEKKPVCN